MRLSAELFCVRVRGLHVEVTPVLNTWGQGIMPQRSVMDLAKHYGARQAASKAILPDLAMAVARAAVEGKIAPDGATTIYAAYREAAGAGLENPLSFKAQVSKLRQIVRLASEYRTGLALLEETRAIHDELNKTEPSALKPAYAAMVDVARSRLGMRRALTRTEIAKLCRK